MDKKYKCGNCDFYDQSQSCKYDPKTDVPKDVDDFCGNHSKYQIDNFAPLTGGAPSGGNVNPGTVDQFAYYAGAGSVISGTSSLLMRPNGQVNFPPVAAPTNKIDGDFWFDSTRKIPVVSSGGLQQQINRSIYRQFSPANPLVNPQTYASLLVGNQAFPAPGTLVIPPQFWAQGRDLTLTGWPTMNFGRTGPISFRMLLDSVPVITLTTPTLVGAYNAYLLISTNCRTIGTSGLLSAAGSLVGVNTVNVINMSLSIDLSIPHIFDLQTMFANTDPANSVSLHGFTLISNA